MLNKHNINGETYVKLNDLNAMLKSERMDICEKIKEHGRNDGKVNTNYLHEHATIRRVESMVNEANDDDKYVIFSRDQNGEWTYFMELVKWDDIPSFVRRHLSKREGVEYSTVGTGDISEATLYDCEQDAQDALAQIQAECKEQAKDWHYTRKRMFGNKNSEDALLMLYYDGPEDAQKPAKPGPKENPKADKERRRRACPGRYTVWYRNDEETTQHCMGFVKFEKGAPLFTNRPCEATWFVWRGAAEQVAKRCGEGFEVVDMYDQMTPEQRLLRAIFREDGMDGEDDEYHGDGTRAENEDWDGEGE